MKGEAMKVDKPNMTVTLNKKDLDKAFKSPTNLYDLLRTITIETYGKAIADIAFPVEENKK